MISTIKFDFNEKEYSVKVISSLDVKPCYHWVLFEDEELKGQLGEDLALIEKEGKIEAVQKISSLNKTLYYQIIAAIEKHLAK